MSTLSDLQHAKVAIEAAGFAGTGPLLIAIELALRPPAPRGVPSVIGDRAADYLRAATDAETVRTDLDQVARSSLPDAWRGEAAESAGQAVEALGDEVRTTAGVLRQAATQLLQWSEELSAAQARDQQGREALADAGNKLGFLGLEVWNIGGAASAAIAGVDQRIAAAQQAETGGTRTASVLRQLTSKARAENVRAPGVDALTAVVLANEANPGGGNDILSPNALDRGSKLLAQMSPGDRAAFEKMLAQAKSPEEAAYLWKALGAGHSLSEVQAFDAAIHAHGGDPAWLAKHLTPDLPGGQADGRTYLTYNGQTYPDLDTQYLDIYDQGNVGDCVAASTIIAHASTDPTVMLGLTTGGTGDGDDSPAAFHQRLQDMYVSQYIDGQHADGDSKVYPQADTGLGSKGEDLLANRDLGASTGSQYHYVSLGDSGDRQNALTGIENAVDSGKPVPIDVHGGGEGHQMMIIGRDGDRLQIYNPWGYTTWVSESDFVNDNLGGVTGTDMTSANAVELPK